MTNVVNLTRRLRTNVAELKLANNSGKRRVAIRYGFRGCFLPGFIPAISQHGIAHAQSGLVGDQAGTSDASHGFALEQGIEEGAEV